MIYLAAARAYLGVKWRRMGSDSTGMDCAGLLLAAARDAFGISYDPGSYLVRSEAAVIADHVSIFFTRAAVDDMLSGDILLFRADQQMSGHCGVYDAAVNRMVHADAGRRAVVEETLSLPWRQRITAVYRVK